MKTALKIFGICIGCVILLCVAAGLWIWFDNTYTLELNITGDQNVTVEYGQNYVDEGASARFYGTWLCRQPLDVSVTVSGQVDTRQLGKYQICYTASYHNLVTTAYRTIQVVDTKKPVITLESDPAYYTIPGLIYREEGFEAWDNVDGNLNDLVTRKEKDGVVVYTVTDSSGNTASVSRKIQYFDPIPPELTLLGGNSITLKFGTSYQEPGYTAIDNCDGDITDKVVVSGDVKSYVPGTYTVTYSVTDTYKNTTTVARKVTVLPQPTLPPANSNPSSPPQSVPANGKVIYLTFDDGPGPNTGRLLDVLAKYNVKATFFVVNTAYINQVARIVQEGHAVGIHTTNHRFDEIYASDDAFFEDLYTMQSIIESYSGIRTTLMRFPGGSSNTISKNYNRGIMTRLTQAVQEHGFQYFDWNVDSRDAGGAWDTNSVVNSVVSGVAKKQSAIVLQHDIKSYSVDAVEQIIVWGLSNGYTFLPLNPSSPGCHHRVNN